jgi:hypothetical protein
MGKLGKALRDGVKAAADEYATQRARPAGDRFFAGERLIRCRHCDGERFERRDAMLASEGMGLLHLGWLDSSATALVCVTCTGIEWFAGSPEREE